MSTPKLTINRQLQKPDGDVPFADGCFEEAVLPGPQEPPATGFRELPNGLATCRSRNGLVESCQMGSAAASLSKAE